MSKAAPQDEPVVVRRPLCHFMTSKRAWCISFVSGLVFFTLWKIFDHVQDEGICGNSKLNGFPNRVCDIPIAVGLFFLCLFLLTFWQTSQNPCSNLSENLFFTNWLLIIVLAIYVLAFVGFYIALDKGTPIELT